jgi:deoxyguanosine kinase
VRIEVCGGIASGKTTLAAAAASLGLVPCHERFQENPFISKFYADVPAYAFETEITYLLQHYSQTREALPTPRLAADFSLALDLAYAYVTLQPADQQTFAAVLDRVVEKIGVPSLIVRLECDSRVELDRIETRNRQPEQSISLEYLDALDSAIDRALESRWFRRVPVVRIDSHRADFRADGDGKGPVLQQVAAAIRSISVHADT